MVRAIHCDLARKWYDHERNESGMTMSRKECVKITTTKFCGTSVFESTMKLCLRTDLVITDEREREGQIHVRICYDRWVFVKVANTH